MILNGRQTTQVFASHKYTKEAGGAQDKQFDEMYNLLERFRKVSDKNTVLIVIVDGEYYNQGKMKTLKKKTRKTTPKSFVAHIEDIPEILASL